MKDTSAYIFVLILRWPAVGVTTTDAGASGHASAVGTRGLAPRLHTNHGRSVVLMALVLVVLSLALRATSSSAAADTATAAGGDGLFALLQRVPFRNAGLAQRSDRYAWGTVPVASGAMFYLEKENVSCTQCSWGGNKGKPRFLVPPPPPPPAGGAAGCAALNATLGVDIAGHDLKNTQDGVTTSADCLRLCCGTPGCDGAVFLPKTGHSTNAACTNASRACCFLKTGSALAPRAPLSPLSTAPTILTIRSACSASCFIARRRANRRSTC